MICDHSMITVSWDVMVHSLIEKVPNILKQMFSSINPAVPGMFYMNGYWSQCSYSCNINMFRHEWKFILFIFLNKHILKTVFLNTSWSLYCGLYCGLQKKYRVGVYQHFGRTSYPYLWGTLNMDALCSYKTLVPIYRTWYHNPEDQSVNVDYLETSNFMTLNLYISVMLFLCVSKTVQPYYIVSSILLTLT